MAGRGRPRKNATTSKTMLKHVEFTKMHDVKFDPSLFTPIKTGTIVDTVLSNEGGVFPGTNTVVIGDHSASMIYAIDQQKAHVISLSRILYASNPSKFNTALSFLNTASNAAYIKYPESINDLLSTFCEIF